MAIARYINPVTGDVSLDGRTWRAALTPELAIVVSVLRTPLGSAGRDRTYGIEEVDNELPNAVARHQQAVATALKRWTARGTLRDLVVTAVPEARPMGTVLRSTITFRGRDGRLQSIEVER
ncbi:MAG: hypothetical protein Q8S73_36950 [Deltaproteobacteria bacterium]|nr:hypothetical protein [Myxococcales bacterium]MDP3219749.1 hypothetical protein [Deltaproteobacteria bacterium]